MLVIERSGYFLGIDHTKSVLSGNSPTLQRFDMGEINLFATGLYLSKVYQIIPYHLEHRILCRFFFIHAHPQLYAFRTLLISSRKMLSSCEKFVSMNIGNTILEDGVECPSKACVWGHRFSNHGYLLGFLSEFSSQIMTNPEKDKKHPMTW